MNNLKESFTLMKAITTTSILKMTTLCHPMRMYGSGGFRGVTGVTTPPLENGGNMYYLRYECYV